MYHGLLNVIINNTETKEGIIEYLDNLDNFEVDKSKNLLHFYGIFICVL